MKPAVFFTKVLRRCVLRFPNAFSEILLRNHLRKWCVEDELATWTKEGFQMWVSPRDYLSYSIFFYGEYDPFMTAFIKAHVPEGAYCIDLGAERGWFTLLMAHLVGPSGCVEGFEAFPPNFKRLQANVDLNEFSWAKIHNVGISRTEVELYFVPPSDEVTHHTGFLQHCGGVGYLSPEPKATSIKMACISLDKHCKEREVTRLDLIKIDVEGAEFDALSGAMATVRQFRPLLVVEYNRDTARRAGTSIEEIDALLESYQYDRFTFWGRLKKLRLSEWSHKSDTETVFNVYCFPRAQSF